ncbi:MAG: 30S ribosome-binding factor RbfA [Clostridiales bacterium]|nr:30S ribosome-binding factor RbfA [Clostridiales bacterium]
MAAYDRIDRISEEVRRTLDAVIRDTVRDPRVSGTFSIVRADVTRDLKYCKVRVSVLEEDKREPLIRALTGAAGFIRRELGSRMDLRYTPELLFELDLNMAYADHINRLLRESGAIADGNADGIANGEGAGDAGQHS